MEKRHSKRKRASLDAKLICSGKNYTGFIENICEHGLHLITASKKSKTSFIPEKILKLKIQNKGNKKSLNCEIRWVHINKTPIHGLTYRMGMKILKQPPEYKEFLNTSK
jgi:hypothetical protein